MDLPKRKPTRLIGYDYSTPGAYFITVCTKDRKSYFWAERALSCTCSDKISLSKYGEIVCEYVLKISEHYPSVTVDNFTVMPNHIHLLLQINTVNEGRPVAAPTVSRIINQVKGVISKKIGFSVWQKGFYDHVIRCGEDYMEVWKYIDNNPARWLEDELYIDEK